MPLKTPLQTSTEPLIFFSNFPLSISLKYRLPFPTTRSPTQGRRRGNRAHLRRWDPPEGSLVSIDTTNRFLCDVVVVSSAPPAPMRNRFVAHVCFYMISKHMCIQNCKIRENKIGFKKFQDVRNCLTRAWLFGVPPPPWLCHKTKGIEGGRACQISVFVIPRCAGS